MSYVYSLSTKFPNGVDLSLLDHLIRNDTTITTFLLGINIDQPNNQLTINFLNTLSTSELTALNNIINNYNNNSSVGNIVVSSNNADSGAIQLLALNQAGGIVIQSGLGGINLNTTNAFNVTSGAQSGISVSNGNLVFNSTNALTNIDGYSGINIGNNANTGSINIATGAVRNINIGSTSNNASGVIVKSGTNGINATSNGPLSLNGIGSANLTTATSQNNQNLNISLTGSTQSSINIDSQGTGNNAIKLNSVGGIMGYAQNNPIQLISNANIGNAINLDTNTGGGGIIISSGSYGIGINSNGGALGIGHFSGGPIYIGTAAVDRDIYIGNSNNNINLITRTGKGYIKSQKNEAALPTAGTVVITVASIMSGIIYGTPTLNSTLLLPNPSDFVTNIPSLAVNDSVDFSIINQSVLFTYTVTATSNVGNKLIASSSSGLFRIKFTSTSTTVDGFILFRLA